MPCLKSLWAAPQPQSPYGWRRTISCPSPSARPRYDRRCRRCRGSGRGSFIKTVGFRSFYVWFSKSFVFLQCLYPCAGVDDNRDFVPGVPINNGWGCRIGRLYATFVRHRYRSAIRKPANAVQDVGGAVNPYWHRAVASSEDRLTGSPSRASRFLYSIVVFCRSLFALVLLYALPIDVVCYFMSVRQ